jgi:hypothetical protein
VIEPQTSASVQLMRTSARLGSTERLSLFAAAQVVISTSLN